MINTNRFRNKFRRIPFVSPRINSGANMLKDVNSFAYSETKANKVCEQL